MSIFEWDGVGRIAYCDGWPMPGVPAYETGNPSEISDEWSIGFLLENGAELTLWCGYRTPGPKIRNLEGRPAQLEGEIALWVPVPTPPGEKKENRRWRPAWEAENACAAWLSHPHASRIDQGVPSLDPTDVRIEYRAGCAGFFCEGCGHGSGWADVVHSARQLQRTLAFISGLSVVAV